jgi:GxxExxY protein
VNELTYKVLGCAIEVHKHVGPGLIESVYEKCFVRELAIRGLQYKKQLRVPMEYKGLSLEADLRLDVVVEDILCVELKAIEALLPIHEAILMTYMRMLQKPKGVLINFNCKHIFKYGQKTLVNELFTALPDE